MVIILVSISGQALHSMEESKTESIRTFTGFNNVNIGNHLLNGYSIVHYTLEAAFASIFRENTCYYSGDWL